MVQPASKRLLTEANAAAQAANPATPLGGALSATFVPKWKANTAYLAGDAVLSPSGDTVTAKANFTSGATYSASNWNQAPALAAKADATALTAKLDKTEAASTYATQASLPAAVASAVGASGAPAAAAAAAVSSAMAAQTLSYTVVSGAPHPVSGALTVVRGTPVYGTPAKFGNAMSGGLLREASVNPEPVGTSMTAEMWVRAAAPPSGNQVPLSLEGVYLSIVATSGYASLVLDSPTPNRLFSSVNVCDGNWHHIAFTISRVGGVTKYVGFWVDGNLVSGTPTEPAKPWGTGVDIGGFSGTAGFDFAGSMDSVRVSKVARYAGNFTPPTAPHVWDANTIFIATLDDNQYVNTSTVGYPARPVGAIGGSVTYVGPTQPTDWITPDRWFLV